jgi:tetratricopeptide (TPR) repeat protein
MSLRPFVLLPDQTAGYPPGGLLRVHVFMSGDLKYLICIAALALALLAACGRRGVESEYDRGRKALNNGELAAAKTLLEQAILAHPGSPHNVQAYNDLGVVSWRLGETDNAVQAFEDARNLNASYAPAAYNLGVLMLEGGNEVRASTLLREAARLDEEDTRALEMVAAVELGQHRWQNAEELLSEALSRDPRSARIHTGLGIAQLHTSGHPQALAHLLQALEIDSRYAPAYFNLAQIHRAWLNDVRTATEHLEQFIELSDDEGRAAEAVALLSRLRSVESATDGGQPPPVVNAFTSAVPDVHAGIALAEPLPTDTGDATIAESSTNETPSNPEPDPFRATLEAPPAAPNDGGEAPVEPVPTPRDWPPEVESKRPTSIDGLLDLARQLSRRGQDAEALQACRDAAERARHTGNTDALAQVLISEVTICPDQASAQYDYGLFLLNADRADESLRYFRRAVTLSPKWVPGYLGMAEAGVRTGAYEAAQVALQRALRLEPAHREALWGMAFLYDRRRLDPEKGVQAYRDFIARHGDDPRADTARQRITALLARARESAPRTPAVLPDAEPEAGSPRGVEVIRPPPPIEETREPPPEPMESWLPFKIPKVRNRTAAAEAYNRGTIYQAREDWERAGFYYQRALEADDSFAVPYYHLGVVYSKSGNLDRAEIAYLSAIRLEPHNVNSRFNLALLYRQQGRKAAAMEQLGASLRQEPEHPRSHYLLGLIYSESADKRMLAERHFRIFLRVAPSDPAADSVRRWFGDGH